MGKDKKSEKPQKELRYERYANDRIHLDITEDGEYEFVLINNELRVGIELRTKDKNFLKFLRRTIDAVLKEDDTGMMYR